MPVACEKRGDAGRRGDLGLRCGERMTTELRALAGLDRLIHEPSRLIILTVLYRAAEVDFRYLQKEWKFTPGNLSRHLRKLEAAGYVTVKRAFKGRFPRTVYSLSDLGREALAAYARMLKVVSGD